MVVTNDGGSIAPTTRALSTGTQFADYCNDSSSVVFRSLNHGFGVTQFYHGAVFPAASATSAAAAGQQHAGRPPTPAASTAGRRDRRDGGYVAVDPVDPNVYYGESQFGQIAKIVNDQFGADMVSPRATICSSRRSCRPESARPALGRRRLDAPAKRRPQELRRCDARLDGHVTALDVAAGTPTACWSAARRDDLPQRRRAQRLATPRRGASTMRATAGSRR